MRLSRAFALLAAVAVLALAGCSTPAAESETPASAASAGYPTTIDTTFGPVTIESKPARVVALGWGDAETALSLGTQPVGASDWLAFGGDGIGPWAEDAYDTPPTIIDTLDPSYEQIAALKPDLILDVRSSGDPARYQRLSAIAPTVGVPKGGEDYLTTTEQEVTMIAQALGVPDEGAAQLQQVGDAFAAATEAHPDWQGKTVTAATRTSESWGAYIDGTERVQFLQRLGFVQNPTIAALPPSTTGFSIDISSEQLDLMDADLIVAFPIWIDTSQITDDPQWNAIPAVANGHSVVIDGDLASAFSLGTPQAELYAIDHLVPLIDQAMG